MSTRRLVLFACSCWFLAAIVSAHSQTPQQQQRPQAQGVDAYASLVAQAMTDLNARNATKALEESQNAIKLDPNRWQAYVAAAGALEQQKMFDAAIEKFADAAAKAPEDKKTAIDDLLQKCIQERANAASGTSASGTTPTAASRTAPAAQPSVPLSPPTPAPAALPPIGTDTSEQRLEALHTRSAAMKPEDVQGAIAQAANGSTEAMLVLAYFYKDQNDATKSQEWFVEASKRDDPLAWAAYGILLPPQLPERRDLLSKAADHHIGIAETVLALTWLSAASGPQLTDQGKQMLFRAAQDGDTLGLVLAGAYSLGLTENEDTRAPLEALGIGIGTIGPMFAKDIPRGKLYLETAAARGEPVAKQYLQQAYKLAILIDPNPSKPRCVLVSQGCD